MVYVDDISHECGRMELFTMIASTHEELVEAARRAGVPLGWLDGSGTPFEHIDVTADMKRDAQMAGALEVTALDMAIMCWKRRGAYAKSK